MLRSRLVAVALTLVSLAAAPPVAAALDLNLSPSSANLSTMWQGAQRDRATATADGAALRAQPVASDLFAESRRQMQISDADYRFRVAARAEQIVVYAIAVNDAVPAAVEQRLDSRDLVPLRAAVDGLHALWRAAGIDDLALIRIRYNRTFEDSAPVTDLLGFYRAAGARYSIDWTYLAAINYVESDFGRVNGPSSAGAMGPMQFMPSTWDSYGNGGDIMNPHDAIETAARYLHAMGGPGNMTQAIYRYNNDSDYVASIKGFAAAFRSDPTWVDRMYYWSTAG